MISSESDLFVFLKKWEKVSLYDLACYLHYPIKSKIDKGDTGHMIESLLGAQISNSRDPDLKNLGIEIKTLPICQDLHILENTFLSSVPLPFNEGSLLQSQLWKKISKIVFITIVRTQRAPSYEDYIGKTFILDWAAERKAFHTLMADWALLSSILLLEEYHFIDSTLGEALHIRPKARNALHSIRVGAVKMNPMGFYLRKKFLQPYVQQIYL